MDKLDKFDTLRLIRVKGLVKEVMEYNYTCDSNKLYKKLHTIYSKLDKLIKEHGDE